MQISSSVTNIYYLSVEKNPLCLSPKVEVGANRSEGADDVDSIRIVPRPIGEEILGAWRRPCLAGKTGKGCIVSCDILICKRLPLWPGRTMSERKVERRLAA